MNELIFSWAEDANGKMVHVDNVRRGLNCGCHCPCCHERLKARHGDIRSHGFAHCSENRRANLKICYMVIMYKLAEQIIQEEKRIHVPSYYGIYKERDLEFSEVIVDDKYDRIDKQPDVIAITAEGMQYLIEFTFAYKVQHNDKIDYTNLNCLEIDLSSQTLESLRDFLLNSNEDKKWLNNQTYFDNIESTYSKDGKSVKVTNEHYCAKCIVKYNCCGVKLKGQSHPITIENSGHTFRVCKTEEYECRKNQVEELNQRDQRRILQKQELSERYKRERSQRKSVGYEIIRPEEMAITRAEEELLEINETSKISPESRTCFICKSNLEWMCRNNDYAHCGPYLSLRVPKNTPPDTAKTCPYFRVKIKKQ